jgi:hypothetical protein
MAFNDAADNAAREYWYLLKTALQENNYQQVYSEGIRALFYATAHIGPPVVSPDDPAKLLSDEIRHILQDFFDKMKVSSSNMILQGKTGQPVVEPPVITVLIDSTPLSDIPSPVYCKTGKVSFTEKTDAEGRITFGNTKIPSFKYGTLFYVSPDPGKIINAPGFISAKILAFLSEKVRIRILF